MTHWIFLSKGGADQYINDFALGSGGTVTNTDDFDFDADDRPIVLRGILKHKIMKRCWQQGRDFYYMDTGYLGNTRSALNPNGWKYWHRVVKNDLQHALMVPRPQDRLARLQIRPHARRHGSEILVAAPDDKPCRFYGIDRTQWIQDTVTMLKTLTDRPIRVRERVANRRERMLQDPLSTALEKDVHALVTFNSNSAIEAVLMGVPAFVLAPVHAAAPVANTDLGQINDPYWPDSDKLQAWACHLAYCQWHVDELRNGTAYRMLNAD